MTAEELLEIALDRRWPPDFPLSGTELAEEAGTDYQRVQRLKAKGVLDGLWTTASNGRIFFKEEAIQIVKDSPRGLPGRPPGAKQKMNFAERAQALKAKAEERRKMLNGPYTRLESPPESPSREPNVVVETPLDRVGCVTIGDKDFVLAARKGTAEEKPCYFLFDESQTDMLGNRVARPVREGELKISDVVQLIGTLFTTVENQFAVVDRATIDHGRENLKMVSDLLDVGTFIAPLDLLAEADERKSR